MRTRITESIHFNKYLIANATGIPALMSFLNRRKLLVLAYHGIFDDTSNSASLPETFVHVKNLKQQLIEIKRKYRIIEPDELTKALENRVELSPNSALITFDDGYESFHRLAFPVLESLGIKAIVFVNTKNVEENIPFWFDIAWTFGKYGTNEDREWIAEKLQIPFINNFPFPDLKRSIMTTVKKMPPEVRDPIAIEMEDRISKTLTDFNKRKRLFCSMNPTQMRSLSEKGTTFGGHTHNHTILTLLTSTDAKADIKRNKEMIESIVDNQCDYFAYPNGGKKDFSLEHKRILTSIGFIAAFSLTQGRSKPDNDPFEISRLNVAPEDTEISLIFKCSGIVPLIKDFKRNKKFKL
jgi:peptidoglycan/xylan/chitin deacetylase (PgdA/CDA1 family)